MDRNDVVMEDALVCLPDGNRFEPWLAIGFRRDAFSDTLTDSFGIGWHRAK